MHGRLLVAHQNVIDLVLPEDGVVDMQCRTAGIAPDMLDTGVVKRADENVAAG